MFLIFSRLTFLLRDLGFFFLCQPALVLLAVIPDPGQCCAAGAWCQPTEQINDHELDWARAQPHKDIIALHDMLLHKVVDCIVKELRHNG